LRAICSAQLGTSYKTPRYSDTDCVVKWATVANPIWPLILCWRYKHEFHFSPKFRTLPFTGVRVPCTQSSSLWRRRTQSDSSSWWAVGSHMALGDTLTLRQHQVKGMNSQYCLPLFLCQL
jgi:hypothetical protein